MRRRFLALYLNDLMHHPIVGRSNFLRFFLEEQMGGPRWKPGKRAIEKEAKETGDKFLGNVLCTPLPDPTYTGERIESFMRYLGSHEKALLHLHEATSSTIARRLACGAELDKEKDKWGVLAAEACYLEGCGTCTRLSQAMKDFGTACHWEDESLRTQAAAPYAADIAKHVRLMALSFMGMRKRLESYESAAMKAQMQQLVAENGGQALPPGDERAKHIPDSVAHARAAFCAEIAAFHSLQAQDLRTALLFAARQQRDHHKAVCREPSLTPPQASRHVTDVLLYTQNRWRKSGTRSSRSWRTERHTHSHEHTHKHAVSFAPSTNKRAGARHNSLCSSRFCASPVAVEVASFWATGCAAAVLETCAVPSSSASTHSTRTRVPSSGVSSCATAAPCVPNASAAVLWCEPTRTSNSSPGRL